MFRRTRVRRADGRVVELRSFRAVTGAHGELPLTKVGRMLAATGLDRLPRVLDLVAGRVSLFA